MRTCAVTFGLFATWPNPSSTPTNCRLNLAQGSVQPGLRSGSAEAVTSTDMPLEIWSHSVTEPQISESDCVCPIIRKFIFINVFAAPLDRFAWKMNECRSVPLPRRTLAMTGAAFRRPQKRATMPCDCFFDHQNPHHCHTLLPKSIIERIMRPPI